MGCKLKAKKPQWEESFKCLTGSGRVFLEKSHHMLTIYSTLSLFIVKASCKSRHSQSHGN